MHLCLFEDEHVPHFAPLTDTRPVYALRLGRRTVMETTREAFGTPSTLLHVRGGLAEVTAQQHDLLTNRVPEGLGVLFVNGRYVPEPGDLLDRLRRAADDRKAARVFVQDDDVVAAWVPDAPAHLLDGALLDRATFDAYPEERVEGATLLGRLWHLLDALPGALTRDHEAFTDGRAVYERPGAILDDGARLVDGERIVIRPGARVHAGAVLNAEDGPIYLGEDSVVMENAVLRGPVYVGPKAQVKPGASIEGSALGYWSKVGGEVHGSVLQALSNKGHAGYLGDSYLGRWCNLGADTNTSNLRNDYGEVSLYDAVTERFESTGRQFVGLVMGDHAKCSINTMFNTGTVVGVFANLFGAGFHDRHVGSFRWGRPGNYVPYRLDKALSVAEAVMARRDTPLTEADRALLTRLYEAEHGPLEA